MKRFLPVLLAVIMIFSITATVSAKDPFTKLNVPKCTTAPTIDGVISDGEYKLVATYDKTKPEWNRDSSEDFAGKTPELYVYATWDDTNFYVAVQAKNLEPNYTQSAGKVVFEQPSLMTAMVYDDPTLAIFASATGKDWDWGAAAATTFGREWTIGITKEGIDFTEAEGMTGVSFFGKVRDHGSYEQFVKHGYYDVYEQAIPWAAIAKTSGIEVGGKCGFAISACVLSTTADFDGAYIDFASGIDGGKSFDRYAQVTLTANTTFDNAVKEPVATEPDTSESKTSTPTTPDTGDLTPAITIIAVIAIIGAGVVAKKRSR